MRKSFQTKLKKSKSSILSLLAFASLIILSSNTFAQLSSKETPAIGTAKIWGKVDNLAIKGLVQGPSASVTPLQVACVFEYTEGDIYNSPPALPANLNGMVHLDQDLKD